MRGGHAVTRACVRKRAGETRGLLHSSDHPPSLSRSAGLLSATLPISWLQKGVFPSCPALRGLSQSCIFGITQPFWAWLLASSPTLPACPIQQPVPWRGAGRRQLGPVVRAAMSPVPSHCATPTPRPGAPSLAGRCPRVLPPRLPPRWPGQPHRVCLDRAEGVGWRGAGRKGGAVGLVLSWRRNLENVALLGRLWGWGAGGLHWGEKSYWFSISQYLTGQERHW